MQVKHKNYLKIATVGVAAAAMLLLAHQGVEAADHAEAPGTMMDAAADIADFYAWHKDEGTLVAVVTFAALAEAGSDATYDLDVLYGIHIDNNNDDISDIDIWCRFGTNMAQDEWGVQCLNVPGAAGPLEGNVETEIVDADNDVIKIWAGPREDPFFFDLQGFQATLMTGELMFDNENDSLAGTNVTAIVVEMDSDAAAGGEATEIQTWTTTARL